MREFKVHIEQDAATGLFVGSVTGWPGAHSQGRTREELLENLRKVIAMLQEDGEPAVDPDVEDSWLAESERRLEQLDSGQVESIPWEQVKSRLRRRLAIPPEQNEPG
jgi:putative addiction module component (TIGR02574 family)